MSAVERISAADVGQQPGHVQRYEIAARLVQAGDVVLDAACGVGYGAEILADRAPVHTYYGVDRDGVDARYLRHGWFTHADLNTWSPQFGFDVGICLETLEHLANPLHLAAVMASARKSLIVSVPTEPTKHLNPYHLHDFTVDDVCRMFEGLTLVELIPQPAELSHIFVFDTH